MPRATNGRGTCCTREIRKRGSRGVGRNIVVKNRYRTIGRQAEILHHKTVRNACHRAVRQRCITIAYSNHTAIETISTNIRKGAVPNLPSCQNGSIIVQIDAGTNQILQDIIADRQIADRRQGCSIEIGHAITDAA